MLVRTPNSNKYLEISFTYFIHCRCNRWWWCCWRRWYWFSFENIFNKNSLWLFVGN